jgi:hypothetical protein
MLPPDWLFLHVLAVVTRKQSMTQGMIHGIYLPTVSSRSGLAPTCTDDEDMIHGIPVHAYCSFSLGFSVDLS